MNRALLALIALVCLDLAPRAHAATSPLKPEAGGIFLRRTGSDPLRMSADGELAAQPLRAGETWIVSFPKPMAASADFDRPGASPPIAFTPAVPLEFRWKSATEGEVIVRGPLRPATSYRLALRTGLRDLAGEAVIEPAWGLAWPAEPFRVSLSRHTAPLSVQPTIGLRFSHPVAAAEVARTAIWRDDLGATTESEVRLAESADAASATDFTLVPLRPLEPGRTYELLIEDTACALDGTRLPFVHVFALGAARPLRVEYVRALHQPKRGAFLELRFDQKLDATLPAVDAVHITPAVKIDRVEISGPDLRVFGAFAPGERYAIELPRDVVHSRRGFGLEETARWHATFGGKRAAVILPRSILTTPALRGLDVDFTQVNTGPLHWQLARVPAEAVASVRARLDEYRRLDENNRDSRTREFALAPTKLLVPDLDLPVVTAGTFDATDGDREVARTLHFTAAQLNGGVYLLELSGSAADGRLAGNRALVLVNREFLVWKTDRDGPRARLFDLISGKPLEGAAITVLDDEGQLLGAATTGREGDWQPGKFYNRGRPALVLVERNGVGSAHFAEFTGSIHWQQPAERTRPWRHWLFTDRGLYRPGETVHVKGIARVADGDTLMRPPTDRPVTWRVLRAVDREPVIHGEVRLSDTGAWETEIVLRDGLALGTYLIAVEGAECSFRIDEFRAPAFAVELHAAETSADATSRVRVISHYFHGAPNAKALVRWRAIWRPHEPWPKYEEDGPYFASTDFSSPDLAPVPPSWARFGAGGREADADARSITLDGTTLLDANGAADLSTAAPFPANARLSAAQVRWEISVIAIDGQTVSAGGGQLVPLAQAHPAVALASHETGQLELDAIAVDLLGNRVAGVSLLVAVYHVAEKTVREILSPQVVRYRNTAIPTRVFQQIVTVPFHVTLPATLTGRYVAVAELVGPGVAPRASVETTVSGQAVAEFAQWNDTRITVTPDRPSYVPGDTAQISVRAPFAGRAWVTVETDRVLASFDVVPEGNAANLAIPVTSSMHPNAYVHVYLFRPAEQGGPAERQGSCELRVRRPETELQITTELLAARVEPREMIRGSVTVRGAGRPAADADVTLFAVDEAILQYGQWQLPDPQPVFFPPRWHEVSTTSGLGQFKLRREDDPLFQKGFLIGDGSLGWRSGFVRAQFRPLAFWQGSVRTDGAGRATFAFAAPDNLTDYRIVAVAHHGTEAFGHDTAHVQVARRLQTEPALPRFLRAGDEVDLRVVLRQTDRAELSIESICQVEGATLLSPARVEKTLARAIPVPAVFRARVNDDAARVRVHFAARATAPASDAIEDAVEVELPVRAARIVRHEAIAGIVPAAGWSPATALPAAWRHTEGEIDVVISSSPWLPLFSGLPSLLEYPHGCVEQISGRVLAYALMGDLLRGLPDGERRVPAYRDRVTEGLARLARAQLANGDMPYWPGSNTTHPFATIQTAWAVAEAQRSGWEVPEAFLTRLRTALVRMVRRQDGARVSPTLRTFALMVAASLELEPKPRVEALELYRQRDALRDDGRAFLALALHRLGVLPEEKRQLIAELTRESADRVFVPEWFGSAERTAALRLCARATVAGSLASAAERADQQHALAALMASSQNFSTQEHLWMLLAFRALVRSEGAGETAAWELSFAEPARSVDGRAVGWYRQALTDFEQQFAGSARLAGGSGSFLLSATYRTTGPEPRVDRGFRLERIVRNLTAPARDGSAGAPFQLGDEVAVTFRVLAERDQAYVSLEESLPAAFETIDPQLYRAAQWEKLGAFDPAGELRLSHFEKRDDRTLWYFDTLAAGVGSYTAIVRVTSAGRFHWPGATIAPMYDARFSGVSEGLVIDAR